MKKILMRFLAFAICFIMCFTLISCGDKTARTTDVKEGSKDEGLFETVVQTEEPEMVLDLQGRKVRTMNWWNGTAAEKGKSELGDKKIEYDEFIRKKYNFEWEYVSRDWAEYTSSIAASVLANDPCADFAFLDITLFLPAYPGKGLFISWNDLKYLDPNEDKWDKLSTETATYNGKVYGSWTKPVEPRGVFIWNKTMFEKNGLPSLYETVKNNQWTWEKMREYAFIFTQDTNQDGVSDQWGYGGDEVVFIYTNNGQIISFDENGKANFALNNENALEAMQFIQDLWQKDKVMSPTDASTNFKEGKLGMLGGYCWMADSTLKDMPDKWGFTVYPMGPKINEYKYYTGSFLIQGLLTGIENPDDIAFVFNKSTDPIPGITEEELAANWESRIPDDESAKFFKDVMFGKIPGVMDTMNLFSPIIEMSWTFMDKNRKGEGTPKAIVEEIAGIAQQKLDDLYSELE